ncbi:hypothetical protein FCH28_03785 [Streptomyces piniterrae]|uniref:XRE family transcriptional regulator n=1 Tax=Streptomyces piniterrae TaxID=2571125 RepID=A0A4U0NYE1_9ACTN|nr:hypothetical protein [Streptomyces piniterrae]TJZ59222.1 hypothetical protein FCH28_03785 [Streptomyces piniterrae]
MDTHHAIRHPLALLREQSGLSHGAYAQLIAKTHAELGFGSMAARREKVARWESGKVTPETSAQLAMAHLHDVPRSEVLRTGWPDWLYAATGHSGLLTAPWTGAEALQALDRIARPAARAVKHRYDALSSENGVADLVSSWRDAAAEHHGLPASSGRRIDGSTVDVLEQNHRELHHLYTQLGAQAVRPSADAGLRMVADLARNSSCDQATRARLLSLAASAAGFSGWLAFEAGDHLRAQSAFLAELRTAAAAGDPQVGACAMIQTAKQKLELRDLAGTHLLLDAAERLCASTRPSRRMSALIAITAAAASALQGDADATARQIDTALTIDTTIRHDDDPCWTDWLTTEMLLFQAGNAYVYLGKADKGLDYLLPVFDTATAAENMGDRDLAFGSIHIAMAHTSAGDVDEAIPWVRNVPEMLGRSPAFCVEEYYRSLLSKLNCHSQNSMVREFLDEQRN